MNNLAFENEIKDALKKLAFNRPMRDFRPITAGERVRQYRAKRMITVKPPRPVAKPA